MIPARTVAVVLCLSLLACGARRQASTAPVLATWNPGGQLTVTDLDAHLLAQPAAARAPRGDEAMESFLERTVRRLFVQSVLLATSDPAALAQDPGYQATLDRRWRREATRLYLERFNARFEVSQEEIAARFAAERSRFERPERRAFNYLLLTAPADRPEALAGARERAEELRAKALAGASFEELVKAHSQAAGAAGGGLVGPVTREQLRADAAAIVFALAPGEVSDVLCNRAGCQLFRLDSMVPALLPDLELLQATIAEAIASERRRAWLVEQLEREALRADAQLPDWVGEELSPADLAADAILLRVGEAVVTVRDLDAKDRRTAAEAVRNRAAELLLPAAFERDAPQAAADLRHRLEEAVALEVLHRRGLLEYVTANGEQRLRESFESQRSRYQSDPEVELAVFSWPLASTRDPLAQKSALQPFADALAGADSARAKAELFGGRAPTGGRHEQLAQTPVRALANARPEVSEVLIASLETGQVIGPYRYGNRLYVVRVDAFLPPRELGFLEARGRVLDDLGREGGSSLVAEWEAALAAEHRLRIDRQALAAFGASLATAAATAAASPAPTSGGSPTP